MDNLMFTHQPVALTHREIQVIALAAGGRGNKEIARELALSVESVKTYMAHVMAKFGVTSRTRAAVAAFRSGLIA
jgi:two-component system, NarL family, response regulator LiaR